VDVKINICDPSSDWYCRIDLDLNEWPPIDDDDQWLQRPIRQWVYQRYYSKDVFFAARGWILFAKKEDAVLFQLTWSG